LEQDDLLCGANVIDAEKRLVPEQIFFITKTECVDLIYWLRVQY
jgi:hypothetical protein